MMRRIYLFFLVLIFPFCLNAQSDSLRIKIAKLTEPALGKVGIAIMNIESGDTITYNGKLHLPMQSVFKFPIAMAIMSKVDSGKLSLNKKIHLSKSDMIPETYSPLRDKYPAGNVDISIRDLLSYMVSQSDNVACDALIKFLGGPKAVNNYVHGLGATGIQIVVNEDSMHKARDVQYNNWCEPQQMIYLLYSFYEGKYLSKNSTALLYKIMTETTTSPKRIRGLLPKDAVVAHKSGSSGTYTDGVTPATNDVGIITLPNGKHVILAAFVSDSHAANDSIRETVIAKTARLLWDNAAKK